MKLRSSTLFYLACAFHLLQFQRLKTGRDHERLLLTKLRDAEKNSGELYE